MLLPVILGALAALSAVLTLWQFAVARRFPLHARATDTSFAPGVSLLKPLKGRDAETERCLRSWFAQKYSGPVQILLGVADADDPVCELVRALLAAHPHADAELVICGPPVCPNAKVSSLAQLERLARHELIIISDADVRVPPDLLANLVAPLRDPAVGLVNCFYQLANPRTLAMRCEAIAINADFWSQVLQSRSLKPLDFALGAVMATRGSTLRQIGGFAVLGDDLADDYQLGQRIAATGARIELSPVVVECWEAPMNWRQVWAHQLRWARTIRACQPAPYFFNILSNATVWPVLWFAVCPTQTSLLGALGCIFLRRLTAAYHYAKLSRAGNLLVPWLAMLKDFLGAIIWAQAFLGWHVMWRGVRYRVLRGGKLARVR
ncbi:MAG: hypothetical protein EXS35_18095 [Pedosphaera sp.]|nr:hypothetical protein [Pedosphaera sp.]